MKTVAAWMHLGAVAIWVSANLVRASGIDWRRVPVWYESPSAGFTVMKLTNTAEALYIYVESSVPWTAHTIVFFDTDALRDTGYHGGWMAHGYDVMCDAWNVYAYVGQGYEWSWTNIGTYTYRAKGNLRELRIPRAWLEKTGMVFVLGRTSPPETFIPGSETDVKPYDWVGSAPQATNTGRAEKASAPQAPRPRVDDAKRGSTVKPSAWRERRHEALRRLTEAEGWQVCPAVVRDGAVILSNGGVYVANVMPRTLRFQICQRVLGSGSEKRAVRCLDGTFHMRSVGDVRVYRGRYEVAPLTYEVFFSPMEDGVKIAMLARADSGCVIQAGWALGPLDEGLVWHDDVRTFRAMRRGETYANVRSTGVGLSGRHARYPWGVVSGKGGACGLLVDVSEPVFHFLYSTGEELGVRFDAVLSEATARAKLCAAWEAVVCRLPPDHAWRAAIARYYATYPEFAHLRGERRDGLWLPFTALTNVAGVVDFGFAVHEYLYADPTASAAQHVAPFFYHEPTLAWWPMRREEPRTVRYLTGLLTAKAREGDHFAQAVLQDGERDRTGGLVASFVTMPWNDGARIRMFPLPDGQADSVAECSYADYLWSRCVREVERGGVCGLYIDSMNANSGFTYAPQHLARLPFPAVTALGQHEPAVHGTMALYLWCEYLAAELRPRGQQLMGNYPYALVPFVAQFIDVPGEETTWYEGGVYQPMALTELDYVRAMSGEKSYLFLQCCDFEGFGPYVERYVARCAAYGFFPSMFSHNSADQPYWETPRWYERDRSIFARYVPVIAAMARARWRPVADARCDGGVVCEQFGAPGDARGWWVSLYNPDTEIMAGYVHLPVTGRWVALQPLAGTIMPVDERGRLGFALAGETWLPCVILPAQEEAIRAAGQMIPVLSGLVERTCAYVRTDVGSAPPPVQIVETIMAPELVSKEVHTSKGPLRLGATAVCPPALVTLPAVTHVTSRAVLELPVMLRVYAPRPVELVWQSAGGCGTVTVATVAAGVTQVTCAVASCRTDMPMELTVRSGTWEWRGTALIKRLARGENLLRASDVAVRVDSCFPGYTLDPLRDGVKQVEGVHWSRAAWASAECGGAHWIEVELPEARRLRTVRVYWHKEEGRVYTARALEVWGAAGEESLQRVWQGRPRPGSEVTDITLPTMSYKRVRLVQPDGMGAVERPHLMWVREVEVSVGEEE